MVPVRYNYRNLIVRWKTTLMTASGFTLVVAALIVMLAFVSGIETVCAVSGEPENVLVLKQGNNDEVLSQLDSRTVSQIEHAKGVARDRDGKLLASRELFMVIHYRPVGAKEYRFLQLRGVLDQATAVHTQLKMVSGAMFKPSQSQIIIGRGVQREQNLKLGDKLKLGRKEWTVSGVFDAKGSAFESEIWCDLSELAGQFKREGIYSTVVVRAESAAAATALAKQLAADRQVSVEAKTEPTYYAGQAEQANTMRTAGLVISAFMAIGAVFGIMNTMFAAIGQRTKDIGVLRILGFQSKEILVSFLLEALLIAAVGGLLGSALGYCTNGLTRSTAVGAREVEFAFHVDSTALMIGAAFTFIMGFLGGLLPALSAMRIRPLESLR